MKTKYLAWAALALLTLGCSVQNTLTSGEFAREYLSLWMDKYHPGISANSDGLYILKVGPNAKGLEYYTTVDGVTYCNIYRFENLIREAEDED